MVNTDSTAIQSQLQSSGFDTVRWAAAGAAARFCKVAAHNADVISPGKQPLGKNWQESPYTADQVKQHIANGGNVGLLTGKHSGDDTAGHTCILDADEDYSGLCSLFGWAADAPAIVRDGADKGKIIILVTGDLPKSKSYFHPGEKAPFFEFLSTGRQGVIAGIHPSGAEYRLINADKRIPRFSPARLNAVIEAWTGQSLEEFQAIREQEHQAQTTSTREHGGDGLFDAVLARWSTLEIFKYYGRAGEIRKKGEEVKLKDNGGLFVNESGTWYCFSAEMGGGPFQAWQYCRDGNTNVPTGRGFYELLCEMAEAGGVPIPPPMERQLDEPEYQPPSLAELEMTTPGTEYEPGTPQQPTEPAAIKTFADMAGMIGPVEWAWRQWLPQGLLTIFAGESGAGKSAACLRIAACYLCGLPWPDDKPFEGETGAVLWCEAEAAQAVNLDRARAWGLPLDKLYTPTDNPLEDIRLDNPQHRALLFAKAKLPEVRLIIIDSLRGILGRADENGSETLNLIKWLAELARDTGKPIILTHHLRKRSIFDGEGVELERLRGSSAIVQTARLVWALDIPDQGQKERKRLSVIKSNLDKFPEAVGMWIDDSGVNFGQAPTAPKTETVADRAVDLLLALLQDEPKTAEEIQQEFDQAGISIATMKRAKAKLGIVSVKDRSGWKWALPAKEQPGRLL